MNVNDLKAVLENKEDVRILDVREKEEFESGTPIPGAENIPMGKVFVEVSKGNLPKDKKIITVCRSGGRADIVAHMLEQKGYDVENLEGGMNAWEQAA